MWLNKLHAAQESVQPPQLLLHHARIRTMENHPISFMRAWLAKFIVASLSLLSVASTSAQVVKSILEQDSTLNNFVDPPGYQTTPPNTLGAVKKVGHGPKSMILIPGLGFGGDVFNNFMASRESTYTMYAVTLAGFGGTPAPPSPDSSTSFGAQTWTNYALTAIEGLIEKERLNKIVVVGHWLTGPQIAIRLAQAHPDKVSAVIIIAGSPCFASADTTKLPTHPALDKRAKFVDMGLAPRWFKTVTRETWDDNNFRPGDYANNHILNLRLWRRAYEPPLHVWVRYLCEYHAQDITLEMGKLTTPILLVMPGLEGIQFDPGNNYMYNFCYPGWDNVIRENKNISVDTVANARVFVWEDQPHTLDSVVNEFLLRHQ